MYAGRWIKMNVSRRTYINEPVTCGNLKVILSSTSTRKKFSLSIGGEPITELIIPQGSDSREFWYYDENAGSCRISVWTGDYPLYGSDSVSISVMPKAEDVSPPATRIDVGSPQHQLDGNICFWFHCFRAFGGGYW
ncbi:MAG: hypothetical protein ACUVQ0_06990 [Thermoproteota archaeon]